MVRGLDLFRQFFAAHADQYVLIGGTAATLAMEAAGLNFRATKDLDVVLHIEAIDAKFGEAIWRFIEAGRYEIRQASATGKPIFYRFQKPADENYPAMLELFSRAPAGLALAPGSHLTPIPIDEAVASLSAILLDNDYYDFVLSGRRQLDGLPWVGEDRLIPRQRCAAPQPAARTGYEHQRRGEDWGGHQQISRRRPGRGRDQSGRPRPARITGRNTRPRPKRLHMSRSRRNEPDSLAAVAAALTSS
jgi:hypothetical protein